MSLLTGAGKSANQRLLLWLLEGAWGRPPQKEIPIAKELIKGTFWSFLRVSGLATPKKILIAHPTKKTK